MKHLFIAALSILVTLPVSAQEDYFYAEQLIDEGKEQQAKTVLTRLIDSNVYITRPGLHMKTLNLAGTVHETLNDTAYSEQCYRSVILYYDSLNKSNKQNDFIRRERYIAYCALAQNACGKQDHVSAIQLLNECGAPGVYYCSANEELMRAQDEYYRMKTNAYQQAGQADSAFLNLCRIQIDNPLYEVAAVLRDPKNKLVQVASIYFGKTSIGDANTGFGYLYAATWSDEFNNLNTIWALNYVSGLKVVLGQSSHTSADLSRYPHSVDALHLSPDEKWLAVASHGPESNSLELIDFNALLQTKDYLVYSVINAFPGKLTLVSWEESILKVQSDADLVLLNRREKLTADDLQNPGSPLRTYTYNLDKKKFEKPLYSKVTEAASHSAIAR